MSQSPLQEQYHEMMQRLGAMLGAMLPNRLAAGAAGVFAKRPATAGQEPLVKQLLKNHPDVRVLSDPMVVGNRVGDISFDPRDRIVGVPNEKPRLNKMPDWLEGRRDLADELYSAKRTSVGTMAHEFGHSRQQLFKKYPSMGSHIKRLSDLGLLGSSFVTGVTNDESVGLNSALAGTAAGIPQVASELQASYKGSGALSDAMRQIGRKPGLGSRLSTFRGVPSYALGAGIPLFQHYLQKAMGLYNKQTS